MPRWRGAREILSEASKINERLKVTVAAKQQRLDEMMRELEDRTKRHKAAARSSRGKARNRLGRCRETASH